MSRFRLQILAAAAIFALAWTQFSSLEPKQESGTLPIDPPTPYIHYFGSNPGQGRVLVIHGLDVSKEVMRTISSALADASFEVYNIDLPGHGDSPVAFRTDLAEQAIHNAKRYLGDETIVLGHSLGAGLLLDLAATEQFTTMVLLAPPPIAISAVHAERVLIATGDLDIPRIRNFAPIAADIGDPHVETWLMPWSAHSAGIFNPVHIRRVIGWLGGEAATARTWARLLWLALMFVAAVAVGIVLMPDRGGAKPINVSSATVIATYVVSYTVALLVLKLVNPVSWLHIFATDYLVGFVLVSGLVAVIPSFVRRGGCASNKMSLSHLSGADGVVAHKPLRREEPPRPLHKRRLRDIFLEVAATLPHEEGITFAIPSITAVFAAAFVIVVLGHFVGSHFLHISLLNGRWWRFPCIAGAGLPLFLSDELTIRRIPQRWKSEAIALLTRLVFLAFILTGVLTLNRESGFLVLIAPLIVIFWIALWFAAGVVHRHTQSPFAAALFAAIVQGWAFAAWFVTI